MRAGKGRPMGENLDNCNRTTIKMNKINKHKIKSNCDIILALLYISCINLGKLVLLSMCVFPSLK